MSELKQHLSKQHDQIEKLRKEKAELIKVVKASEDQPAEETPEELSAQATRIRKSLSTNIKAQMVYRNKFNKSRIAADVPNLSLSQVRSCLHRRRSCHTVSTHL